MNAGTGRRYVDTLRRAASMTERWRMVNDSPFKTKALQGAGSRRRRKVGTHAAQPERPLPRPAILIFLFHATAATGLLGCGQKKPSRSSASTRRSRVSDDGFQSSRMTPVMTDLRSPASRARSDRVTASDLIAAWTRRFCSAMTFMGRHLASNLVHCNGQTDTLRNHNRLRK